MSPRNLTDRDVRATDVVADADRAGALVPGRVVGAPVRVEIAMEGC